MKKLLLVFLLGLAAASCGVIRLPACLSSW